MQDAKPSDGSDQASNPQNNVITTRARMRYGDRAQVTMQYCALDELLPKDHPVRMVWQVVEQLDLSRFEQPIGSREQGAGRPANDVRVMVCLWLWGATEGVGGGRELAELCENHAVYRWICAGLSMNYHTLNDFRTGHEKALDELFTQVLGHLMHEKVVTITRISQDGLRVRASAGSSSFRRGEKLQECLKEAREHLAELKKQRNLSASEARGKRQAAREFAAQDRVDRISAAINALKEMEQSREQQYTKMNKQKRKKEPRASTTDADARVMKMPNGGFNPAYNVQLASDPVSRAIVGVEVSSIGSDKRLSEPMRKQVEERARAAGCEQKVSEHLMDGGFLNLEAIDRASVENVTIYAPAPEAKSGQEGWLPKPQDSAAVAQWRQRMASEAARQIYLQRASTSETINADLRTYRGLNRLLVRGINKVKSVVLWSALAYNIMHFGSKLLSA